MQVPETQLTVRPAQPADLETLVSLLRLLFAIEDDFQFDEERQQRGLALMLANPLACILVAEVENRVVGMCTGQLTVSTAEGGPALLMEDVVVADEFRGRGAGRLLVSAMGDWAAVQGAFRLQLLADRNNGKALAFYARLGWQTTNLICLRSYRQPGDRQAP